MNKFRLGRIAHWRCNELKGYTYLFVPEDKTEDDFAEDMYNASEKHLQALKADIREKPIIEIDILKMNEDIRVVLLSM